MKRRIALFLSLLTVLLLANAALASSGGRRRSSFSPERVEGVLTAVAPDQLTVRTASGDKQIKVTPATLVKKTLNVGDKVEVQVTKASDGTLTAVTVEVETDADVEGIVKTVSPTSITITTKDGDQTFTITKDTILLLHGVRTTTDAIKTGDKVEVHSTVGSDNTRVARLINLHTDVTEIAGTVTTVADGSITVQPRQGGDPVKIAVTPSTVIRFAGRQTTASTIGVGAKVEVLTMQNADKTLTAVFIQVENPNDLTEIKGAVTAIDASSITVNDTKIAVNGDTIVRIDDKSASLSDVKVGNRVKVSAKSDGTTLTAVRIQVENADERFTEVKGQITKIAGSIITVQTKNGPVDVSITSSTTFRGGSASSLATGMTVEISAKRNADGSLEALNVEVEDASSDDNHNNSGQMVEIEGTIDTVSATSITVKSRNGSNVTATIDAKTVVVKDGHKAAVSDLKSGQRVQIAAQKQTDNSLLAKLIRIDD